VCGWGRVITLLLEETVEGETSPLECFFSEEEEEDESSYFRVGAGFDPRPMRKKLPCNVCFV